MSSPNVSDEGADLDPVSWESLTPARKRVAKAVSYISGPGEFDRPTLKKQVKNAENILNIIDNRDRLLTSLSYTRLLNKLVEDGYLLKTYQGGQNPVVLDTNSTDDDEIQAAPFGAISQLHDIVDQVKEREGLSEDVTSNIDLYDANEVIDAINNAAGKRVLMIYSEPSRYFLPRDIHKDIMDDIESEVQYPVLSTDLYKEYETIDIDTFGSNLRAVVDSTGTTTLNVRITKNGNYVDEAFIQNSEYVEEININATFDVIYMGDNEIQLVYNPARTEETRERIKEIIRKHKEQMVTPDEWQE